MLMYIIYIYLHSMYTATVSSLTPQYALSMLIKKLRSPAVLLFKCDIDNNSHF